jgi:SAM-dependent methyltransferase
MIKKMNECNEFQLSYWSDQGSVNRRSPDHPVVERIVYSKLCAIEQFLPLKGRILEIGCGNGHFTHGLARSANVVAVDFSLPMLRLNPSPAKVVMDGNRLGFGNDSFDIVFSSQLLHHVDDPVQVVGEMKRVSSKYIVILEPNRNNPAMLLLALMNRSERNVVRFTRSYMKRIAESNGLKIIGLFLHGSMPPNKTPAFMAPFLDSLEGRHSLGLDIVMIAEKE